MPGDTSKKLRTGDRIPAEAFNSFQDAVRAVKESRETGIVRENQRLPAGTILVTNISGTDQDQYHVLALRAPIITPAENQDEFERQVTFNGDTPTTVDAGRFVVLQEPIAAGEIGRAVIAGVTIGRVQVTSGQLVSPPNRAEVESGTTSHLVLTSTGSVDVLWQQTLSVAGEAWAVLRLSDSGAVAAGSIPDATHTVRGAVSLFGQDMGAGLKTFVDGAAYQTVLTGTNAPHNQSWAGSGGGGGGGVSSPAAAWKFDATWAPMGFSGAYALAIFNFATQTGAVGYSLYRVAHSVEQSTSGSVGLFGSGEYRIALFDSDGTEKARFGFHNGNAGYGSPTTRGVFSAPNLYILGNVVNFGYFWNDRLTPGTPRQGRTGTVTISGTTLEFSGGIVLQPAAMREGEAVTRSGWYDIYQGLQAQPEAQLDALWDDLMEGDPPKWTTESPNAAAIAVLQWSAVHIDDPVAAADARRRVIALYLQDNPP